MMRKLFLTAAVLAVMVYSCFTGVSAQETVEAAKVKNDVVVSISSFGELRKTVVDTANKINPMIGIAAAGALGDGGALPPGLATSGPIGLVVDADMTSPMKVKNFLGFVPVKDGDAFSAALDEMGLPVIVNVEGKTALLTLDPNTKAPADPASLLGGLDKRYLVAIQIAPKKLADLMMLAAAMGGDPEALENAKDQFQQMEAIMLGLNVDKKSGDILLDVAQVPVAGSDLAANCAKMTQMKSKLVGFYDPNAMAGFQGVALLTQEVIDTLKTGLADAGDMPEDVKQIFIDTLDTGKLDIAASVNLDKAGNPSVVFAVSVADGTAVEKALKNIMNEKGGEIEMNAANIMSGVRAHKLTSPDGREVAVALTKTYLFVAFGQENPMEVLKEKVTTTLKADSPKTNFQAHLDGSLLNATPLGEMGGDFGGKITVKGYVTEKNATMKMVISQKILSSGFQAALMFQQMQGGNAGGFGGDDDDDDGDWDDEE